MRLSPFLLVLVLPCCAQKYEVASIKPSAEAGAFVFDVQPDGSLAASGITLNRLMMTAYNVQGFRIMGAPGWVRSRRWDLQAKPDRPRTAPEVRPMLRRLLEERFQLRTHSERRMIPVYELVIDGKGVKVRASKDVQARPDVRVGAGSVEMTNETSATFASQISYAVERPVIDKTGLGGPFDFKVEWTPEPEDRAGPSTQDGPSIFTAIREQLGLRLVPARGLVDVVVVDDVRLPGEN